MRLQVHRARQPEAPKGCPRRTAPVPTPARVAISVRHRRGLHITLYGGANQSVAFQEADARTQRTTLQRPSQRAGSKGDDGAGRLDAPHTSDGGCSSSSSDGSTSAVATASSSSDSISVAPTNSPAAHTSTNGGGATAAVGGRRAARKLPLPLLIHAVRRDARITREGAAALITAQIKLAVSWQEACSLFVEFSDVLNSINIAALVCHLPKIVRPRQLPPDEREDWELFVMDLQEVAAQLLPGCRARELANLAHGFAALGVRDRRLMQLLLPRFRPAAAREQELANLLWALATMDHQPPAAWLADVVAETGSRLHRFSPQELTNTAWALVQLRARPSDAWLSSFCAAAHSRLGVFEPADVSMALWALAALQHEPPAALLDALAARAALLAARLEERHVASMLWALAELRGVSSGGTDGAAAALGSTGDGNAGSRTSGMGEVDPEQERRQSHAAASSSGSSPAAASAAASAPPAAGQGSTPLAALTLAPWQSSLQHTLCGAALRLAPRMRAAPRNVSTLLVACVRLGWQPPSSWVAALLAAVQDALAAGQVAGGAAGLAPHCTTTDASTLVWALARLGYRPPGELLARLEAALPEEQLAAGSTQEASNLLWAMAKLQHVPSDGFVWAALSRLAARPHELSQQDCANALWALARMRKWQSGRLLGLLLCRFVALVEPAAHARQLQSGNGSTAPSAEQSPQLQPQQTEQQAVQSAAGDAAAARHLANVVHSLYHLGKRGHMQEEHRALLPQLVVASGARLNACGRRELVQLVCGWAAIRYHPGGAWLRGAARRCLQLHDGFDEREARQLRRGLARLVRLRAHALAATQALPLVPRSPISGVAAQQGHGAASPMAASQDIGVPQRMLLGKDLVAALM